MRGCPGGRACAAAPGRAAARRFRRRSKSARPRGLRGPSWCDAMLLLTCPCCGVDRRGDRVRRGRRGASEADGSRVRTTRRSRTTSSSGAIRAGCISSAGGTPTAAASGSTSRAAPRRSRSSAAYPAQVSEPPAELVARDPGAPSGVGWLVVSTRLVERRPADRPRAAGGASRFDGRTFSGFAGDTLASALLANDVTAGRAVVQVSPAARNRRERRRGAERADGPRRGRATSSRTRAPPPTLLRAGLVARSQNHWPSLGFDVGA